jgi:hypothetical protein
VNLTASVIVRNEADRYLAACVGALLEFCDRVCILDDGSTDGWEETCAPAWDMSRVTVFRHNVRSRDGAPAFHKHAAARNQLLKLTLGTRPTHILAIDADEFVSDGQALRRACEAPGDVWSLTVEEVWAASSSALFTREDGQWRKHEISIMWRTAKYLRRPLLIRDHGHATGRVPGIVNAGRKTGVSLLHFGWANKAKRAVRFERYDVGDGGKFHDRRHIDSIMWPDRRVRLARRGWPVALNGRHAEILARVQR